ncbi:PD-(D/E)XK nuclease family protein [Paenibacillus agricola]|uniref:PD-(D/E)XK nuclease family protein n=1 Tax=Paenibacillus agricola TaxID=2716264 RepID=A0ABX0JGD9_9BACL|nr:PD-(D/E)XK nuclease family protein [Paenibacillus agricola]NHN35630.1 PD-(D/E)XK nuclease family protein [Paenibacillus agricola]
MAYKPFRDLFLSLFLNNEELERFEYDHFQTQYTVKLNNCRPDIVLTNDEYEILIEVKTSDSGLTENQPVTYLQHLSEAGEKKKFLIFLVPSNYAYQHIWTSKSSEFTSGVASSNIQTQILYWSDLIHAIKKSELYLVSEKVNDLYDLLKMWFEVKKITFTNSEVSCMFKAEIPSTLSKLYSIVNAVKKYCGKSFKSKPITSNYLEYGVFFQDDTGKDLLYFGVWYDFWEKHGSPLCYGVFSEWSEQTVNKFESKHETLIEHDGFLMTVVPEIIIRSENCSEEIAQLIYNELVALTNDVHRKE